MADRRVQRPNRCRHAALAMLLLTLAACGSQQPSIAEPEPTAPETVVTTAAPTAPETTQPDATLAPTPTPATASGQYEAVTSVLESAEHGPKLCLGGMLMSLPPQCGDVAITNWDWSTVDGEQTVNGTTWIDQILVVGHLDGDAFTVSSTRAPTAADLARLQRPFAFPPTPCPEPPGGWLAQAANAPADAMLDMNSSVGAYVAGQPDSGAWWVDQSINPSVDPMQQNDPQQLIVVATFTGDLARHEAELRAIWPGALCVGAASISARDLATIATEINAGIAGSRLTLPNGTTLDMLSWSDFGNSVLGEVEYDVLIADPAAQQYFDDTYGVGRIVLHGALQPLAGG